MIPFVRDFPFNYGQPTRLSPLIQRVIARNPGPFTFTGSGTYLISAGKGSMVIDPGPDLPAHIDAVIAAADSPITDIIITHTHLDHCGAARGLAQRTGARILGAGPHPHGPADAPVALDEGADFDLVPDQVLADGDIVAADGVVLHVVATPGHTGNHLCLALDAEATLFTGDHVMGWATTVIAPPDGDMGDYMDSLRRIGARGDARLLPTHGAPIEAPGKFIDAVYAHRQGRDRDILAALGAHGASILEIVPQVYADIDPSLRVAAALNVRAHLEAHLRAGTIREQHGVYRRI